MKTYDTYQEAKIANPDRDILTTANKWPSARKYIGNFRINDTCRAKIDNLSWMICDPKDYCMTLEDFTKKGYKLITGDLVLDNNNRVCYMNSYFAALWNAHYDTFNNFYILRAEALNQTETTEEKEAFDAITQDNKEEEEKLVADSNASMNSKRGIAAIRTLESLSYRWNGGELWKPPLGERPKWLDDEQPKPKHTKVEYVKVAESIFDLKDELERCELFFDFECDVNNKTVILSEKELIELFFKNYSIYRKVSRELTERESFVEEFERIAEEITKDEWAIAPISAVMFDSGKFKLVDGE